MNINNIKGLTNNEVLESRKKHGTNIIIYKEKNSILKLIIESLSDPIIKILLIALGVKLLFLFNKSDIYEVIGIFIAIFISTTISTISEYGSEEAYKKLKENNSKINTKVIRNSKITIVNSEELVVGDIIYLESGMIVPADGIIIDNEIYVDESNLTGETQEKLKKVNDIIYMSSIVTNKRCLLKVTEVGNNTIYGKITNEVSEEKADCPLKIRLKDLAKTLSKLSYICALIVFVSYLFNSLIINKDFINYASHLIYAITLSVTVVVMAVPEGLPMMITLVLSSNMKRLLKRNVLVKRINGIETSGSLNILLTDKTGTLTEGKLKVIRFTDSILNEYYKFDDIKSNKELIYQSLVYNNNSFYLNNNIEGSNTTDKSILEFTKTDKKDKYKILYSEEFNSKTKYSLVKTNYNNGTTFIKGAYEIILNKCKLYETDKGRRVLIDKKKIMDYIKSKTLEGERVLALAYTNTDLNNLTLLGFIFMKDNIRKDSFEGVKKILDANIQVVMVTGDSEDTAVSIAKSLNIINSYDDVILTSEEFNKMSDEQVINILNKLKVLSRSLPQDKNRLVKLYQSQGLVVGMTGDGVNDAPALKKADVSFSLGSATEIAKETSDIILLDDNINSIATSILYGRTIFKSIRKFIIFQLTINFCAVSLSIVCPFIGVLSPITIIQMLWINMVMDTLASLAFSFEPALNEYMKEPPKDKKEKILNKYMKNQILISGIYSTILCIWFLKSNLISTIYRIDSSNRYILTAFFGLFIFLAIFNAFNSRTFRINTFANILKNKIFIFIIIFIAIVQVLIIYFGGELFRTTGLTTPEFLIMFALSFSIIPFDFIRKLILHKKKIVRNL